MKLFILTMMSLSFNVFSRQYIQCAPIDIDSSLRVIINLDGEESTLATVKGLLEEDLRTLNPLSFVKSENGFLFYESINGSQVNTVSFEDDYLNIDSTFFYAHLTQTVGFLNTPVKTRLACFSSLYDE